MSNYASKLEILLWVGIPRQQGSHSPGKLLELYVRPGIFGIISRLMLVLTL